MMIRVEAMLSRVTPYLGATLLVPISITNSNTKVHCSTNDRQGHRRPTLVVQELNLDHRPLLPKSTQRTTATTKKIQDMIC